MQPQASSSVMIERYVASAWNQWLMPEPMTTVERPSVSSALRANSRATRATTAAGMPVSGSCQAGVYGCAASS